MALHGAWPDAQELGRVLNGSTRSNEGCEHILLARSRWPRYCAAQVPMSQARFRLAAASHSSRHSIGSR